ncbi:hypothetical protein BEP19_10815 [Ammoniphilus oxalaticus]|uniref:DUF1657 domain-containing protein n=1 Tax=Ammoniphilus oxalaticus TaxID=66863 RepID=A0A419SG54_9BACL|nr:DUF1657 domain-containing protein [Ammoniphilus oxalaticus]RKD22735.1 hypothetical protein BEP19_10815 [Ammoniphilus oxalaticus]
MTVASRVKQTTASLKGALATLQLYSLQSATEEERLLFQNSQKKIEGVVQMLEQRISILEFEEPQYKGF